MIKAKALNHPTLPTHRRDEVWTFDGRLENEYGYELWKSGQRYYSKPGYGWSGIGKINSKELAKEIEYSIRNDR